MKSYDIIFFDLDDTLFDFRSAQQAAFSKVFEQYKLNDIEQYEKSYRSISKVLWRDLENGLISLSKLGSERFRRLFIEHELEMDDVIFNQDYLRFLGEQTHLVQGAEKVIKELSHKRLAAITNGFTDVQSSRINKSPLAGRFEQIIISEATGFQKPQAGIFDVAFEKMKITNKAKVLMVGDSLTSDMQGGLNYGIDTCWFNPNAVENLSSIKPTYEVNHLEGLLDIVK